MSIRRLIPVLACLGLLLPPTVAAQDAVIVGSVKTRTGAPVRGAYVMIEALGLGTLTNDAGSYRLTVPAARISGTVTVKSSSIGYSTVTLEVQLLGGSTARGDFVLAEQAIALEEVVVTGTAGRLERRAQAAVVEKVDAARIADVSPINNVQTLLQARVAGV
ncbi:MAG: carboxypeptidase-like regulatory domain-containing protein, partial [Longimicrobiales bacterium]|nr:carboxypeptidase-like regulatory domain-containing protein [Longimicrobiales bacterium]